MCAATGKDSRGCGHLRGLASATATTSTAKTTRTIDKIKGKIKVQKSLPDTRRATSPRLAHAPEQPKKAPIT